MTAERLQPGCIRRLDLYRLELPLASPLSHARVAATVLDEVFLVLTLAGGGQGASEVRGNGAYATGHDADAVLMAIAASAGSLIGSSAGRACETVLTTTGNCLAAALLEGAALDALARRDGVPLWRYLGATMAPRLETHASVAFLGPIAAANRAREAVAAGFRRFKIRVGSPDPEDDVSRVGAVREVASHASLILDANGAWTTEEAIAMARRLVPFGIAWLEQPTAPYDEAALRTVRELGGVKVVADESIRTTEDVQRLASVSAVDGVHLKLEKCGAVAALRQAADAAKRAGLLVEIGLMDQGRLGSATVAAIASTVPADAYELWGFERVQRDVAQGLEVEEGAVQLSERPGNGVEIDLPMAARVATWE